MSADQVVESLLKVSGVEAIIKFGSAAREDRPPGDLDLLVVVREGVGRSSVVEAAAQLSRAYGVAVAAVVYTLASLEERLEKAPSFGLHLRDEGVVVGNAVATRRIMQLLQRVELTHEALERECDELDRRLQRIVRHNAGQLGTALGRLYGVGRAACILRLLDGGLHIYDATRAFAVLSERQPDLSVSVGSISKIRPFYDALDGRISASSLDWSGITETFSSSAQAAERLVNAARQ
jgi:predicted nucleotidyltransferase